MDEISLTALNTHCNEQPVSTKQELIKMNKTIENVGEQPIVEIKVTPEKHGIAIEHFSDIISSIQSSINVIHGHFDDTNKRIEHVHEKTCHVITRLDDTINNFDERIESTTKQITEIRSIIINDDNNSEHIHVLTPRHPKTDTGSINVKPANKKRSICTLIKGFVESTTLHGLSRLTVKGKLSRIFWSIMLIGALGLSVLQFVGLFRSYFQYPVYVDLILHSTIPTFPQITVCLHNPYNRTAVIRQLNLWNITHVDSTNGWQTMHWIEGLPEQERIKLGYEASEVLRVHITNNEDARYWKMLPSRISYPSLGNCYVIIPPTSTEAVFVYLNANINTSLGYPPMKGKGVNVRLNQPGLDQFFSENVQTIQFKPSQEIEVNFRLDVYNRLNGVYGGCQDDEELFQQRTGVNYTQKMCLYDCKLKIAQMKCGCVKLDIMRRYRFKIPEQLSYIRNCSGEDNHCFYDASQALTNCQCNDKCIQSSYTAQTSVKDLMGEHVAVVCRNIFNVTCTDIESVRSNFAVLILKPPEQTI